MGWDYYENTEPCPCGKGLIRVVHGMDDWNRTSYDEEILCPECKEKAELEKAAKEERRRVANQKIDMVLNYFKENYMDRLLDKFVNTKSKKAIWKTAYEIGLEICSLSSFYKHTKSKTIVIEDYINKNINWRNLKKIATNLQVKDSKFKDLYNDAAAHIKEFEDEEFRISYLRAKGRI